MNSRSRRMVLPVSAELNIPTATRQPNRSSAGIATASCPSAFPGTFSRKKQAAPLASKMSMARSSSQRSSNCPSRFPATLLPWHGSPEVTQSTTPRQRRASKVRMSDQTGAG
jgi:hypothetical protein